MTFEMIQYASDDVRFFDAGDDLHGATADLAGLDVDVEHVLEALRPGHGGALRAVRSEDPVVADEVDARFGDKGSEAGHKIQWLEEHVGGAIAIGGFERKSHEAF